MVGVDSSSAATTTAANATAFTGMPRSSERRARRARGASGSLPGRARLDSSLIDRHREGAGRCPHANRPTQPSKTPRPRHPPVQTAPRPADPTTPRRRATAPSRNATDADELAAAATAGSSAAPPPSSRSCSSRGSCGPGSTAPRRRSQATDLGHHLLNEERAVEVTWRLSVPAGNETACIVQALNEHFTVVGLEGRRDPRLRSAAPHPHRDGAGRPGGEHRLDLPLLAHLKLSIRPSRRSGRHVYHGSVHHGSGGHRHLADPGGLRPARRRARAPPTARPRGDRQADRSRARRGRPQGERRLPRRQGRAGQAGGAHPPAHRAAAHTPRSATPRRATASSSPAPSSPRPSPATRRPSSSAAARSPATRPRRLQRAEPARRRHPRPKVGDKTSYTAPNGREIAVEVTSVETYGGQ